MQIGDNWDDFAQAYNCNECQIWSNFHTVNQSLSTVAEPIQYPHFSKIHEHTLPVTFNRWPGKRQKFHRTNADSPKKDTKQQNHYLSHGAEDNFLVSPLTCSEK